ncbi:anti-sigma factor [Clostridium manihotivorum]|uniref:Zinc-finger domain-containing protein n=1 Tax=Clostridium manihotivorum TaxID=2320868 RepID=A0A410DME6_9CLOT|nr:zf-HC2 domain-containing protein [Clostridium manihotivorum]QAA30250.1 hypothetical protein C1I91_00300 [Clostridium manihotivorum]
MECLEFKEKVIEFIERQLSGDYNNQMEQHIDECETCRKYYEDKTFIRDSMFNDMAREDFTYSSRKSNIMGSIDLDRYNKNSVKAISIVRRNNKKLIHFGLAVASLFIFMVILPVMELDSKNKNSPISYGSSYTEKEIKDAKKDIKDENKLSISITEDGDMTKRYIGTSSEASKDLVNGKDKEITLVASNSIYLILDNESVFYYSLNNKTNFYLKEGIFNSDGNNYDSDKRVYSPTKRFILLVDKSISSNCYIVDTKLSEILRVNSTEPIDEGNITWSTNDRYLCIQVQEDIYLYNLDSKKISYVSNENKDTVKYVTDEGIIITSKNTLLPSNKPIEGINPYELFAYNNYIYALCYDDKKNTELYQYDYSNNRLSKIFDLGYRRYTYDKKSDSPFLISVNTDVNGNDEGRIFNINTMKVHYYSSTIDIQNDFKNYISPSGNRYISKTTNSDGKPIFNLYTEGKSDIITIPNVNLIETFVNDDTIIYGERKIKGSGAVFQAVRLNLNSGEKKGIFTVPEK